jgi:ferredoxin, 2Fe-2S
MIIFVITRDGARRELTGEAGRSLMEVIRDGGVDEIEAICGGCCACSTCHIYVDDSDLDKLPPMSEQERELLSGCAPRPGSRLACQITASEALNGIGLRIAP